MALVRSPPPGFDHELLFMSCTDNDPRTIRRHVLEKRFTDAHGYPTNAPWDHDRPGTQFAIACEIERFPNLNNLVHVAVMVIFPRNTNTGKGFKYTDGKGNEADYSHLMRRGSGNDTDSDYDSDSDGAGGSNISRRRGKGTAGEKGEKGGSSKVHSDDESDFDANGAGSEEKADQYE